MNGLTTVTGSLSIYATVSKLEGILTTQGFTLFSKIDHSENAIKHSRKLRPTILLIFGNPKSGGTGLMQENQAVAIDLPAKILVWEDSSGQTKISYNQFSWIGKRHNLSSSCKPILQKIEQAIESTVREVAQ